MKKILYILPVLGVLSSCNAYLDMTPKDSISDKVMWAILFLYAVSAAVVVVR